MEVELKWILTSVVAAWGAGLATYQTYLKWRERRVRVRVLVAMPHVAVYDGKPDNYIFVYVQNHGEVEVTFVQDPVVEIRSGGSYFLSDWRSECELPHALKPLSSITLRATYKSLTQMMEATDVSRNAQARVVVTDVIGRRYESRWRLTTAPADWPKSRWLAVVWKLMPWRRRYVRSAY